MTTMTGVPLESSVAIGLRGECRHNPDLWYSVSADDVRHAKAICLIACPVLTLCRDYALATEQTFGVWGGLSEKERRAVLLGETLPAPASDRLAYSETKRYPCPVCGRRIGLNRGGRLMQHEDERTHTPCTGKGADPKESGL